MRVFTCIVLAILIFSSCGSDTEVEGSPVIIDTSEVLKPFKIPELDSAVVYCRCFENGHSSCLTFAAVRPESLCDSSNRLLVMDGFEHIDGFEEFLKSAQLQKNKWGARDARFVIKCFAKDTSFVLTYADYDDNTLWIDNERELKCKRPVLAWIMFLTGLKEIDCPN